MGINYTASQLRIEHDSYNFIFQHRFSISQSASIIFWIAKKIGIEPSLGLSFSKYAHYGKIPGVEITNMSYIYPSMPFSLSLFYSQYSISYRAEYYGNIFRRNQKFSGMRHFILFSFLI